MSYESCFKQLPVIETNRLILRQITNSKEDGEDCLEFINDFDVYRYWGLYDEENDPEGNNKPTIETSLTKHYDDTLGEFHAGRELIWVMERKDTHRVIGEFVLYDFQLKKQADIGYRISQSNWGLGFATEAGEAILKCAFEFMDLTRIQLRCFEVNTGSKRVAEKLHFKEEGFIKEGAILNVMTNYYIFGLRKEDYKQHPVTDDKAKIL